MKVLYITTMYPIPEYPQQGIFCHEQVKALMQLGVQVTVVVPIPFYSRQKEKEWTYEGVCIQYIRFFKLPGSSDFHKTGQALYRRLEKSFDLSDFDIYHADAPLPSGYAAMLAADNYDKPFIVHGHGLDVFLDESYMGNRNCREISAACKLVYEKADAIAGVSQKVLKKIQERVDIKEKAYVVYNGVDTKRFFPVEQEDNKKVVITSIGNLIPLKGHEYTLRAVKEIVDKGFDKIRLKLVGRGELEQNLKNLSKELGLDKFVEFLGYISYSDIACLLQNSDIFVLPSYYEALGCVYLEAMACGIPVIGCKGNGIDEIIINAKNGFLVDKKNVQQITNVLLELMNTEKRKDIGIKARNSVVNQYQWRNSAESLLKVYEKVFSRYRIDGL